MELIGGAIFIALVIGVYNLYMALKIGRAVSWILTHVHIVGKNQTKDPELKQIKAYFGIADDVSETAEDIHDMFPGE